MMSCNCKDWQKYISLIDVALELAQTHTHSAWVKIIYPKEAIFKFCPWCGNRMRQKSRAFPVLPLETTR